MEVTLFSQILIALYSVLFGIFLGLIYDLTSIFGLLFGFKKINVKVKKISLPNYNNKGRLLKSILLCVSDITYFLLASVLIAVFTFGVSNGIVRWYIVFGNFLGFIMYKITLGRLINLMLSYASYFIRYLVYKAKYGVCFFLKKLIKKLPKRKVKAGKITKQLLCIGIKG